MYWFIERKIVEENTFMFIYGYMSKLYEIKTVFLKLIPIGIILCFNVAF